MFAFIDNVAERRKKKREKITHPSKLRVKRKGDARDSLKFEAERIYHRVHGGRNTKGREGWGALLG
jgi:hypothetical protein